MFSISHKIKIIIYIYMEKQCLCFETDSKGNIP